MGKPPISTASVASLKPSCAELSPAEQDFHPPRTLMRRLHQVSPFGSNVVLTICGNVVIGLLGLITGPLCARLLGPTGRGELAAIQNLYWLLATLAMLGLPEATLYFTARFPKDGSRIFASAIVLICILSPLFFAASFLLVPVLLAAQSPLVIKTATWYLLALPLYALSVVPLFALRGKHEIFWWNILRCLPGFAWLVLLLGAKWASEPTPRMLAVGYLVVLACTLLPSFILVRRKLQGPLLPELARWPAMLKYGFPLAAAAVPYTLNVRLDQMIMAAFLPARSLGIYVAAVAWSGAVPPLLTAIGTVLFPRLAGADSNDRVHILGQSARLSAFVALILATAVTALTPFAIHLLFGKEFAGAVLVGVVLVPAAAILGMNIVFEEGLRGLGYTSVVLWGEAVGLVTTVIMLILLLRPLGIMGAGIASVAGYSVTTVILVAGIVKKTAVRIRDIFVIKRSDLSLIRRKFAEMKFQQQGGS